MYKNRSLRNSNRGFTLIEVIIVAILASIIVMITLISFTGFHKSLRFENKVDNLISFIRYGESEATTERQEKSLIILPEEKRLILKLGKNSKKEFKLPDNYSLESSLIKVIFKSGGRFKLIDKDNPQLDVIPNGWIKIRRDTTGDEATITLRAYSGRIKCESESIGKY